MKQITVKAVTFKSTDGGQRTLLLNAQLVCDSSLDAGMICRLAVPRMPLSPTARLLLGLLVNEDFAGLPRQHSYADLGAILGRGKHTAVRAALELRKAGLVTTVRVGVRSDQLLFVCDPVVDWARSVSRCGTPVPAVPTVAASPVAESSSSVEQTRKADTHVDDVYGGPESFADDDHPDWPEVSPHWRRENRVCLPQYSDLPEEYRIPVGVKPWLGPVPRLPDGSMNREMLMRKPFELVERDDDELEAYLLVVREQEEAERTSRPVKTAEDEPPVDASAEREAELKLAGPQEDDSSEEEFRFDSGADTAETDIGRGVKANPDL